MSIKLFERDNNLLSTTEIEEHKFIGEINETLNIRGLANINNQLYASNSISLSGGKIECYLLDKISLNLMDHCEDLETSEELWKCPVCDYEDKDSYELNAICDNYECPRCGAITSYESTLVYNVTLKDMPKVSEVRLIV